MTNTVSKYFLAANSCQGFVSQFENCYNPYDNWRCYIIKGGPGTGKSSFLKKTAAKAEKENEPYVLCPCSSDPDSLDAVIFPNKKTVIMDGTAPHTVNPKYPGVCEEILNFGEFWNTESLKNNREIINLTDKNKELHQSASNCLLAAGKLLLDNYKIALSCTKKDEANLFAQKLIKKYIPSNSGKGYEQIRFISGITPKGIISFPSAVTDFYENTVIIADKYGACGNIIMGKIRQYCLKNGYDIITLKNPFLPDEITDHILIPELSLSFVTESKNILFPSNERRIHCRRFTYSKHLHEYQNRIKLNRKISEALLNNATDLLSRAKAVHDQLESHYIGAMDFDALNGFSNNFCKNLF